MQQNEIEKEKREDKMQNGAYAGKYRTAIYKYICIYTHVDTEANLHIVQYRYIGQLLRHLIFDRWLLFFFLPRRLNHKFFNLRMIKKNWQPIHRVSQFQYTFCATFDVLHSLYILAKKRKAQLVATAHSHIHLHVFFHQSFDRVIRRQLEDKNQPR